MNGAPFRSHLMQQFAAKARTQPRPPIALFSVGSNSGDQGRCNDNHKIERNATPIIASHQLSSVSGGPCSLNDAACSMRFSSTLPISSADEVPPQSALDLQNLIATRRTVSNFTSSPKSSIESETTVFNSSEYLRAAIKRGVECALTAPNHKMTEPANFYFIISPSASSEKLLDVAYEVTLRRLLMQKLSGEEACRSEATRKREKWANIPAFLIATVSGMEDQTHPQLGKQDELYYSELPYVPPNDIQQLEDYASTCASIQNLLLSLHAEGLGSKWATGPIIRTLAFRDLIGCKPNDMVVGLIFIGWPKRVPRMPRRRRELDGNALQEL